MIKFLFTIGNALLTVASVMSLGRRIHHFGERVKYHDQPHYTKQNETIQTSKRNR